MIERMYPGVYLSEVAFNARPIDGVSTSSPLARASAERDHAMPVTPQWTQHNQGDPGITLVQLSAWLGESLLFRASSQMAHQAASALAHWGVAQGLAVEAGERGVSDVSVTPGSAPSTDGRPLTTDSPTAAHHIRKP
ncbi:MAG TPA: hypothetical protein VFU71_21670 [Burkholderiaceae bacterium]|nr:hypothetical protein [Burkholderiaceae bacterium]